MTNRPPWRCPTGLRSARGGISGRAGPLRRGWAPTCATTPPTAPPTTTAHKPMVLIVFDDELAATHFLRVAVEEMNRTRTALPLQVSYRDLLERQGPLGRAWLVPGGGWEPVRPLPAL